MGYATSLVLNLKVHEPTCESNVGAAVIVYGPPSGPESVIKLAVVVISDM